MAEINCKLKFDVDSNDILDYGYDLLKPLIYDDYQKFRYNIELFCDLMIFLNNKYLEKSINMEFIDRVNEVMENLDKINNENGSIAYDFSEYMRNSKNDISISKTFITENIREENKGPILIEASVVKYIIQHIIDEYIDESNDEDEE